MDFRHLITTLNIKGNYSWEVLIHWKVCIKLLMHWSFQYRKSTEVQTLHGTANWRAGLYISVYSWSPMQHIFGKLTQSHVHGDMIAKFSILSRPFTVCMIVLSSVTYTATYTKVFSLFITELEIFDSVSSIHSMHNSAVISYIHGYIHKGFLAIYYWVDFWLKIQ